MVYLMGYSVLVDNEEQARKLQEIALEQGFEWFSGDKKIKYLGEKSFQFGYLGRKIISYNSFGEHYQDEYITKKAHFKDLFEPKFTPIAMKCTQEQFEAIKPKLKGFEFRYIGNFNSYKYLINNSGGHENTINNVSDNVKSDHNRIVHEEWNEEVFLKACGVEDYTLEQQLEKAKAEVERLEKDIENNKIKAGDWVINPLTNIVIKVTSLKTKCPDHYKKITNTQLIELLENEIK